MDLQHKLANLPAAPGVYIMLNEAGEVIYVGKAVNLRNRVRFTSKNHRPTPSNCRCSWKTLPILSTLSPTLKWKP